jgi:hypothetical protein
MIALVNADTANGVERALLAAGAHHVLATEVTP